MALHSTWDFSSPTRDQTHAPCSVSVKRRVLTTGLSGKSPYIYIYIYIYIYTFFLNFKLNFTFFLAMLGSLQDLGSLTRDQSSLRWKYSFHHWTTTIYY